MGWDFNYVDDDVYETGEQAQTGEPGAEETIPTLYLPVDERVEFVLTARDVIHSFWVPSFLYKKDMIPGRINNFQVVPTQEGTFAGKCAELCGEYHSRMLFNVKVVSRAEYDAAHGGAARGRPDRPARQHAQPRRAEQDAKASPTARRR